MIVCILRTQQSYDGSLCMARDWPSGNAIVVIPTRIPAIVGMRRLRTANACATLALVRLGVGLNRFRTESERE